MTRRIRKLQAFVLTMSFVAGPLYGDVSEPPPPIPTEEQPEVLTRGPMNEAFAEPVELQVQAGLVVPTQPPDNIVENPPADKPAGSQFVWVPGYWAWDSERNSYLWVSGCWRAVPPNMYWVPGYWAKVPEGWQWVAGFWAPISNEDQIEYLPAPPALEEVSPPGESSSPDNIWVPPCWYWREGQYIKRSGYWLTPRTGWIWIPSHYVWTPRGYVFVAGYWDYLLDRRGILFAPVYFPRPIYKRPGYTYTASIIIDVDNLQFCLFTCPRYYHYYFGDYYDDIYLGAGIYPWFECKRRHTWYDPIYEHKSWRFRKSDPHWDENQRKEYEHRRANREFRPPKTYREMKTRLTRMPMTQRKNIQMAEPLKKLISGKTSPLKFDRMNNNTLKKLSHYTKNVHEFRRERNRWESSSPAQPKSRPSAAPHVPRSQPDQVKIPNSPVVEKRSFWSVFKKGPPSRPTKERKTEVKKRRESKGGRQKN